MARHKFISLFPLDSLMSCVHSLLGYSTGEFQALQLIVFAAFGAVDQPLAPAAFQQLQNSVKSSDVMGKSV